MNIDSFKDFEKKWEFVTARYRTDTGEQRIVYANKSAARTLKDGKTDYPDGAVFSKIAYELGQDPDFTSSLIPVKKMRVQYMVRDKKKYSQTGGWGYAVTDGNGNRFRRPQESENLEMACHSCHELVREKGFVFSVFPPTKATAPNTVTKFLESKPQEYKKTKVSELPDALRLKLKGVTEVDKFQLIKSDAVFSGTLVELRPTLMRQAQATSVPAVFVSSNQQQFAAVIPENFTSHSSASGCEKALKKFLNLTSFPESGLKGAVIEGWICP